MRAPVRVAMWSGPRNISTAMMRSFEARGDCAVSDEPFYGAYLKRTGSDHPLREAVIGSQPADPKVVAGTLVGPVPGGKAVWYQKHMTLHLLPGDDRCWMKHVSNAFLIREPRSVLASYAAKRAEVTLEDLGFVQQRELFDMVAAHLGRAPPVVDAADVLEDPGATLAKLCAALEVPYMPAMLSWPPGRRSTDGVWAPAWYEAVERSTGFAAASGAAAALPAHLEHLADEAQPHYDALSVHRL